MKEEIQLKLERFEGPLDLLLNLISTNEMDIYDIEISVIIAQYMHYIYTANELNIELASDFIVMAATLLEIKSKKLLPPEETDGEEEVDLEQQLIDRLIEYKVFKLISEYVKDKEKFYHRIYTKEPEYYHGMEPEVYDMDVDMELLAGAMSKVTKNLKLRMADVAKPFVVKREEIPIEDMMILVAKKLKEDKKISFFSLFESHHSKSRVVAIFLAILELYKIGDIQIVQEYEFGDIAIQARGTQAEWITT